jgi:alkylation response protein AidB-like acyl-CoA dehydrogenase
MPELAGHVAFLSEEQRELRRSVEAFLARHVSEAEVRAQVETPDRYDRGTWRRFGHELGVLGMGIPESHGGFGAGAVDLMVISEELGRTLAPQPYWSTAILGATALVSCPAARALDMLDAVVEADLVLAVVPPPDSVGMVKRANRMRISRAADGAVTVDGTADFVVAAGQADSVLVFAPTECGDVALAVVDGAAAGVRVTELTTLDSTRPQARVELESAAGELLADGEDAVEAWRVAERLGVLMLAAEDVGVARRCLQLSVEYAGVREQFGRLIGSYQAIKHKCTDMLIALDLAQVSVYEAARAVDAARPDATELTHMGRHLAQEAAALAVRECVQVHGGIGFTWEHPAHLYFKRATGNAALLGTAAQHLDLFADRALAQTLRGVTEGAPAGPTSLDVRSS